MKWVIIARDPAEGNEIVETYGPIDAESEREAWDKFNASMPEDEEGDELEYDAFQLTPVTSK